MKTIDLDNAALVSLNYVDGIYIVEHNGHTKQYKSYRKAMKKYMKIVKLYHKTA